MKIETLHVDKIKPWSKNPRIINDDAVDAVVESIKAFGMNNPILVNQDNEILAGHTRWKAAKKAGVFDVPVVRLTHLTLDQQKAFNIADNKTNEFTYWDVPLLKGVLNELNDNSLIDLHSMGFNDEELLSFMGQDDLDVGNLDTTKVEFDAKTGEILAADIRQVQLFYSPREHGAFLELADQLQAEYNTKNLSETILEALRAHRRG